VDLLIVAVGSRFNKNSNIYKPISYSHGIN